MRERVEAAERLGISLRRFEGWEPTETTEYVYDEDGRLLRSITTREVEFDEEQQGWMLAVAYCRSMTCDGCGGWLPETTAPDAEPEEYDVGPPYRCGPCTAVGIAQDIYIKGYGDHNPHIHATRWSAERRTDGESKGHGRAAGQDGWLRHGDQAF